VKAIKLFLVAIVVIFASTTHADGEYIGSAFRLTEGGCYWGVNGSEYEGSSFIQFSNGRTGHATFKCKMKLVVGDGTFYYAEGDSGSWPLNFFGYPEAMCYETLVADGGAAMWTAQCFNAWESGE